MQRAFQIQKIFGFPGQKTGHFGEALEICTIFGTIYYMARRNKILDILFFKTSSGLEPVRKWLKELDKGDRRLIGEDIKTAQFGWPIGIPLIRKLETDLWEVRTHVASRITRTFFTIDRQTMVLPSGL